MLSDKETKLEQEYLNKVTQRLNEKIELLNNTLESYSGRIKELSQFISDSFYDMDPQEVAVQRNLLDNLNLEKIDTSKVLFKTEKQALRPYFGRIDFLENGETNPLQLYIGIAYLDNPYGMPYVIDWRAPISSLYYDHEIGEASYVSPDGAVNGNITLKRQYKIEENTLVYAFNSNITISDDILQEALGGNSSSKMKEIVSTIQKEQNALIRSDDLNNLIVQGIAGSGKTSIALHRIAYLIYKNKISSKDIVIISPSPLFSDYISNVLPELGEENVSSLTFEDIAKDELDGILNFETRTEMLESILEEQGERANQVAYKENFEFFESLKAFLNEVVDISFKAKDINLGDQIIKAEVLDKLYNERYKTKTPAIRISWICDYVIDQLNFSGPKADAVSKRVQKLLLNMFEINNITTLYQTFLKMIGMNENIFASKNTLHFEDVAPILYIKDYLLGTKTYKHFKYAVIDEMQDYSPISIALLTKMFPCPKTILGDIYQCIERNLNHSYLDNLSTLIENSKLVKLAKTYRSTMEISTYSQNMIGLTGAINFNRHGEAVEEIDVGENLEDTLSNVIEKCKENNYKHIAIICPTMSDCQKLYYSAPNIQNLTFVEDTTSELPDGTLLIPATLCKGLEFDAVISVRPLPKTTILRNTEYITTTRALHKLVIINLNN